MGSCDVEGDPVCVRFGKSMRRRALLSGTCHIIDTCVCLKSDPASTSDERRLPFRRIDERQEIHCALGSSQSSGSRKSGSRVAELWMKDGATPTPRGATENSACKRLAAKTFLLGTGIKVIAQVYTCMQGEGRLIRGGFFAGCAVM